MSGSTCFGKPRSVSGGLVILRSLPKTVLDPRTSPKSASIFLSQFSTWILVRVAFLWGSERPSAIFQTGSEGEFCDLRMR